MKRWAALVVALYALILAGGSGPLILAAFGSPGEALEFLCDCAHTSPPLWPMWTWFGLMVLAEAALLVVPVRVAADLPIARRHICWTLLATALATLIMLTGMFLGAWEYAAHTDDLRTGPAIVLFSAVGVLWLAWSILFAFYTGRDRPKTAMSRAVRFLLAGSILELLVAVPTHFIARWRNYCCAGYLSFWGLATGFSVLLLAFGPGALLLFARRWQSLRRHGRPGIS
jgi:hypothetical protein